MVKNYTPERGHIVLINFNPQSGKEQAGKRPALVLSPLLYNSKVGLALMCPITSNEKGYPFEVIIPAGLKTKGVVLADHVKNLDWRVRKAKFLEKVSKNTLLEVTDKLSRLIV